jgi:hypothetical protein
MLPTRHGILSVRRARLLPCREPTEMLNQGWFKRDRRVTR